jgi:para-nitrobenzyl esterase
MQALLYLLLQFLSFVLVSTASGPATQTVITLAAGTITGLKISSNLFKFLGIPYAQPPTGNARFAPPVAFPSAGLLPCVLFGCHSNRSINATAFGNICPQSAGGAEDCLSLNVFTTTVSPLALLPVMFW